MVRDENTFALHDTSLHCWFHGEPCEVLTNEPAAKRFPILIEFLVSRGWVLKKDDRYKSLHIYNGKIDGGLECCVDGTGIHIEVKFFQNVANGENRNGGAYDFDKLKRMPYLIKMKFWKECAALKSLFRSWGLKETTDITPERAMDKIQKRRDRWERPSETWDVVKRDKRERTDANGNLLNDGDFRWAYDYTGHLICGKVYCEMNGNWMMAVNDNDVVYNLSCWKLFQCKPLSMGRRHFEASSRAAMIKRRLDEAVRKMDFEKAIPLRDAYLRYQKLA
jgi:hypothetical protein